MNEVVEILLTSAGNILGIAGLIVIIVALFRRSARDNVMAAAHALFLAWVLTVIAYVISEYWVGTYNVNRVPEWLESTNGILENVQSEIIQVWIAALIFKWLRWAGSPESK